MPCYGFAKEERLRRRADFLRLSSAFKLHTAHFILLYLESNQDATRVGFTVSKKVGNAVIRNHIKRRLREFYRLNKTLFWKGDFNFIAKKGAEALTYHQIANELAAAPGRLRHKICSTERS
ncbi:ribonuclease P protein component [Geomesophilobacter sediminis]|uniref:ribonuclease P protein component n=1 Tax=Geomesophilobacter sediminis TaxID=2798584 RepID=UPI001F31A6CB|nr:ribonuclease P protein component [Geomesophilobacter sediminis]